MAALDGFQVVEMAGLGPCPLAGQLLADHGADVIVIDRKSAAPDPTDINRRGKRSIALNLKSAQGADIARRLINQAGCVIEGFRPGVMEKLGLGPSDLDRHVIFGRMTGWGQTGPLAQTAGHDLNYLALTGALHAMGRAGQPPTPPLNLVGDYGGGTMFLLFGILAALFERGRTGQGQVIDAAMVDGVPAMMGLLHQMHATGFWTTDRDSNLLDGGAPFYRCYSCADEKFIAVGCLEPQFHSAFIDRAGLPPEHKATQMDRRAWPARRDHYAQHFRAKTRDAWSAIFDGSDACVSPVLDHTEAADHPHMAARRVFLTPGGVRQSNIAPRIGDLPKIKPITGPGADRDSLLKEIGFSCTDIEALQANGALT